MRRDIENRAQLGEYLRVEYVERGLTGPECARCGMLTVVDELHDDIMQSIERRHDEDVVQAAIAREEDAATVLRKLACAGGGRQ